MEERKMAAIVEQAKRYLNKKTALAIFTFLIVLALSILSSIPEFVINPSQLATAKFFTKTIMSLIIGVTSLVCFIFIGINQNSLVQASKIYIARTEFKASAKRILNDNGNTGKLSHFEQWVLTKFNKTQQHQKIIDTLNLVGITDTRYLNLTKDRLKECLEHPIELGDKIYLDQLSEEQYKVLIDIKNGKYNIRFPQYTDYLYETTNSAGKQISEIIANQNKKKTASLFEKVGSKILIMVTFSVVIGMIGRSTAEALGEEMNEAQRAFSIAWDIISKLCTATGSAFMGYFEGAKFNDFDAGYLDLKMQVHEAFMNDTEFVPKSANELAHEKYVKYKAEETERANLEYAKQIGLRDGDSE